MARTRVRWGRVGALALTVVIGLGARANQAGAGPSRAAHVHVVRPGETLWGLARELVGPQGDPRPVVDRLITVNHLGRSGIHPGDRLVLPSG